MSLTWDNRYCKCNKERDKFLHDCPTVLSFWKEVKTRKTSTRVPTNVSSWGINLIMPGGFTTADFGLEISGFIPTARFISCNCKSPHVWKCDCFATDIWFHFPHLPKWWYKNRAQNKWEKEDSCTNRVTETARIKISKHINISVYPLLQSTIFHFFSVHLGCRKKQKHTHINCHSQTKLILIIQILHTQFAIHST